MDLHFYVYMLRCKDGSYYTGHTDDLDARLWQHRNGIGCEWTKRRRPVELAWCEVMPTRDEAFAAERRIKNWSRAKKEGLIADDWQKVNHFSKPPHKRAPTHTEAPARPERSRGAHVPIPHERTVTCAQAPAGPERSRGAPAPTPHERPSTSLRTSGDFGNLHELNELRGGKA